MAKPADIVLMTPMQLYNLQQDIRTAFLIIDVRKVAASRIDGAQQCMLDNVQASCLPEATAYCASTFLPACFPVPLVAIAKSLMPTRSKPQPVDAEKDGMEAARALVGTRKLQWTVVVCGAEPPASDTQKLAASAGTPTRCSELQSARHAALRPLATALVPDAAARRALALFSRLDNVVQCAYLLGGVGAYQAAYPFMMTGHPAYEEGRLYPSQVTRAPPPRPSLPAFVIDEEENEPVYGGPLFLSSHALAYDAVVLKALGITHVVNVTPDHPDAPGMPDGAVRYLRIPVVDSADSDLRQYFTQASKFIDSALAPDGPRGAGARPPAVLVHCRHGQSRSATIVAAWLMRRSRRREHDHAAAGAPALSTAAAAVQYLKECRPRVSPNAGFLEQLQLEQEGRGA